MHVGGQDEYAKFGVREDGTTRVEEVVDTEFEAGADGVAVGAEVVVSGVVEKEGGVGGWWRG